MLSPSFDRMIAHPRYFVQSSTNFMYSAGRSDIEPVQFICDMHKYSVLDPARLVKCFSQIIGLKHAKQNKKLLPIPAPAAYKKMSGEKHRLTEKKENNKKGDNEYEYQ